MPKKDFLLVCAGISLVILTLGYTANSMIKFPTADDCAVRAIKIVSSESSKEFLSQVNQEVLKAELEQKGILKQWYPDKF